MPSSQTTCDEWALQQVRERRFLINRCDEWLYDEIAPYLGQRVLEIGCGLGNLIRHLADRELVVGIDRDPASIERLHHAYQEKDHLEAFPLDICDPQVLELKSFRFDTVVSLNVFEHIEDDLLALCHARELLQPEGHVVLIVPAHAFLYGTMDAAIGHFRRYDKAMMCSRLSQAGFVLAAQKYLNAMGVLGWFINGRILRRQVPPSGQLRLFNHLVPFVRTLERMITPPIGLSLLSVAR